MPRYRVPFDGASGSVWLDALDTDEARDRAGEILLDGAPGPHDRIQVDVASICLPELEGSAIVWHEDIRDFADVAIAALTTITTTKEHN